MAQYRAIYKNAYVKGLATAVILTSALAAGQAQAAKGDHNLDDAQDAPAVTEITIDGKRASGNGDDDGVYKNIALAATLDISGKNITIQSGDASADGSANNFVKGATLTAGNLLISGSAATVGLGIHGASAEGKAIFNDVNVTKGKIILKGGTQKATLEASTIRRVSTIFRNVLK